MRRAPFGDEPRRHDLRRTAVTRLAEAGCTDDQISSITGLSRAMIQKQVYNVRSKAHSKAGIKKLEDYRRAERALVAGGCEAPDLLLTPVGVGGKTPAAT